jgi:hypothetical protein
MGLSVNDRFSPEVSLPYADEETDAAAAAPQGLDVNPDDWSVFQIVLRPGFTLSASSIGRPVGIYPAGRRAVSDETSLELLEISRIHGEQRQPLLRVRSGSRGTLGFDQ